jgi:hypothetical protein
MKLSHFLIGLIGIIAIAGLVIACLAYNKINTTSTPDPITRAEDFITHYPEDPVSLNAFIAAQDSKTANIIGSSDTGVIVNNIAFTLGSSSHLAVSGPVLFSDENQNLSVLSDSTTAVLLTSASGFDAAQITSGTLDSARLPPTITGAKTFTDTVTVQDIVVVASPLLRCYSSGGGSTVFGDPGARILDIEGMTLEGVPVLFEFAPKDGSTNFKVTYIGTESRDIKVFLSINDSLVQYGSLVMFVGKNEDPENVQVPNIYALADTGVFFDVLRLDPGDFLNICAFSSAPDEAYEHTYVNLVVYA